MLVALLERAPAELWSRSPALCPPLKVMLLYASSKRVRALMRTLGDFIPAWIVVKGDYEFTTANTAPLLRGLQAVPTFSSLKLLMLSRHVSNSIPARVITSALLALEHVCTIEALCVNGNRMRTPHAIAVLSDFVARQHNLSSLHLSHTGVGASLHTFCSAIARQTATENLFLNSAEVHLKRGRTAAPATSALSQGAWFTSVFGNMRMLDLSRNNLASQVDVLLSVLVGLTKLTWLKLEFVGWKDSDGQFFFDMLAGSAFGEHEFAQEFATACPALDSLGIADNQLHTRSFSALKDLLVARPNLDFVDMRGTKACAQGLNWMTDFLPSGRVLLSKTTIVIKEQTSPGTEPMTSFRVPHGTLFVFVVWKYNETVLDQRPRRFFCNGRQVADEDVVGMRDGVLGGGSRVQVTAKL